VLVAAEAEKLKDLMPIPTEGFQRILLHTLLAHGLTATAYQLKRESGLLDAWDDLSPAIHREALAAPCTPETVIRQFKDARVLSNEQEQFVDECTRRIVEQRARIEQLTDRLHDVRVTSGVVSEEEREASAKLKEQATQLEELRIASEAMEKVENETRESINILDEEKARIRDTINRRCSNIEQLVAHTTHYEAKLEEMRKEAENSTSAQAQRIRCLLINWDAPQGPKRIAAETFAHVDSNHDGRLDWQNDEVCRFTRLIFHYHHIAVPPWSDTIWSELFCFCELDKSMSVDVVEAMKFTRGCFEAALRVLIDS